MTKRIRIQNCIKNILFVIARSVSDVAIFFARLPCLPAGRLRFARNDVSYSSRGFTLIEVIVVISLIGVLGFILTDVLTQTLRGQNKIKILNQIKQNGQLALDTISNEIRQSESIACADPGTYEANPVDTIILFKDGRYTRFRFYNEVNTGTNKRNGFIAWDNPPEESTDCIEDHQRFLSYINPTKTPTPTKTPKNSPTPGLVMSLDDTPTKTPTPAPTTIPSLIVNYLTDTDPVNGVSLEFTGSDNKVFYRSQLGGYKDVVAIKFKVKAGVGAGISSEFNVPEEGVLFETTAQVRGDKK